MRTLRTPLAGLVATLLTAACTLDGPTTPGPDAAGAVAATRGQAAKPLPFRVTVSGSVQTGSGPSCLAGTLPAAVTTGGGNASHLGRFRIVSQTACLTATGGTQGEFTWRAANGDLLTGTFTFTSDPPDASGRVTVTDIDAVITGGTGRFSGASGSLSLDQGAFQLLSATEFTFRIALDGTITYDASNRGG